jgi:hypothetical protein
MKGRMNPFQMMNMMSNANNPQAMLEAMFQQNPQLRQTMEQLKNSSGGASPEQIARQLAKQNGISEEQLMHLYNKIHK